MYKIPEGLLQSVAFLGIANSEGVIQPKCTAFYIVVPFRHKPNQGRGYLTTAKHNIEAARGRNLHVSINPAFLEEGQSPQWLPLPQDLIWHDHYEDQTADVVVADWRPPQNYAASYTGVLVTSFLDFQPIISQGIGVGNEIRIVGLFPYHFGKTEHKSLLRAGNISLYPSDRVKGGRGEMDAFLIETKSLGGLSGSPVFAVDIAAFPKVWNPFLGVIHGHWDYRNDSLSESDIKAINSGMSIVSPSCKIIDIVFSDELESGRSEFNCMTRSEIEENKFNTNIK